MYDTFEIFRVDWQLGSGKAARAESTMHFLGQVHVFQSTPLQLLFKEYFYTIPLLFLFFFL